ncbi:MBL fold metallo-hydrolase [Paenibacillus sp. JX-17]|uniref:MBL fold metallo-hydrolase n=1 Tax=Paenibacillus lacisoli TaxID=3064525 RepID=A0ABT9C7Q7_9BACL|nr:MBL fold metallo-hydrolase [Paenibacillus sp. JX-17]MDO7905300.1 MBL fold metallo-hydrolase [Paenibacillus sp. JX-17]
MTLKLQMLGTGDAFAKTYYNNNALFMSDTARLLVDCGTTAPISLHQLGYSFQDLDAVLITHIHADHVGGLEELAFQMRFVHQRRPVLYIAETLIQPLWEHTLKGGIFQQGIIESINDVFEVRPLKPGKTIEVVPGISVELFPTRHIPGKDSYSLYVNEHIFYSADMTFNPELLNQLVDQRGCSLILHECQLQGRGEVHTTLDELKSLPESVRRRMYLMHYSDRMEELRESAGDLPFLRQHATYTIMDDQLIPEP